MGSYVLGGALSGLGQGIGEAYTAYHQNALEKIRQAAEDKKATADQAIKLAGVGYRPLSDEEQAAMSAPPPPRMTMLDPESRAGLSQNGIATDNGDGSLTVPDGRPTNVSSFGGHPYAFDPSRMIDLKGGIAEAQYSPKAIALHTIQQLKGDQRIDQIDLQGKNQANTANIRGGYQVQTTGMNNAQSDKNNVRTTDTSRANNAETTATSRSNNANTTATSRANNAATNAQSNMNSERTNSRVGASSRGGAQVLRAKSYVDLMTHALPNMEAMADSVRPAAITMAINYPNVGNGLLNDNEQSYLRSLRDFLAGTLHQESGARLSKEQQLLGLQRYGAIFGDGDKVRKQKTAAARQVMQERKDEYDPPQQHSPDSGAAPASHAQQLWDAAVAKYGQDKVMKEYGARPNQ